MAFEMIAEVMAEMAVFHLFFPWLLVLAVTFGILQKYEVFGEDPSINGAVALSLAFLTIGGAYLFIPQGLFTNFVGALAFGMFGIVGLMLVLGIAGVDLSDVGEGNAPGIIAIIIFVVAFLGAILNVVDVGSMVELDIQAFNEVIMPILVLIFLLLVVYLTVKE